MKSYAILLEIGHFVRLIVLEYCAKLSWTVVTDYTGFANFANLTCLDLLKCIGKFVVVLDANCSLFKVLVWLGRQDF